MEKCKIYARTVEESAAQQIQEMNKCEAYKDCIVRIMPDCHAGNGCTIGTVIAIKDRIVPNTVGVDIGCGILVIPLGEVEIDLARLDDVIRKHVPSGFNTHGEDFVSNISTYMYHFYLNLFDGFRCQSVINADKDIRSIGTLGGGNHFIEIDEDVYGQKYLLIHSGSRNLGLRVCKYYQDIAIKCCKEKHEGIKELIAQLKNEGRQQEISGAIEKAKAKISTFDPKLAYLDGAYMMDYINDMKLCQTYAAINRKMIASIIGEHMPELNIYHKMIHSDSFDTIHNYIDTELNILRKGAVSAKREEKLIIPINMRDGSLLCEGRGNLDWLYSAPHGAGRLMSRKKAKETVSLDEFKKSMDGIYSTSICESTIDECPMVYKPIDEIMECVQDTVYVMKVIKPIYNFKAIE